MPHHTSMVMRIHHHASPPHPLTKTPLGKERSGFFLLLRCQDVEGINAKGHPPVCYLIPDLPHLLPEGHYLVFVRGRLQPLQSQVAALAEHLILQGFYFLEEKSEAKRS